MISSFRIQRRSACSEIGLDHVGDDGARLDKVECRDGRIHLVEAFAATQKLGVDRANRVEHLLEFAIVGQKLGDLRVGCVGYIAEAWAVAGSSDRGQVSLGSVPWAVGAMATRMPTALVGLDE